MSLSTKGDESLTRDCYEQYNDKSVLISGQTSKKGSSETCINRGNKMQASKARYVAVMAACLYMNMSCFGMFVGLGVIYVELISAFQSQRSEAALVQSLYLGLSLGGGLLFNRVVTKYDTGVCIMFASMITGLEMACGSLAPNIGTVIALVGVVAGIFASVNIFSSYIVINWMFVNNRKLALSILTFGSSIGQIVLPYIADALIEEYSWSGTFLIMGALIYLNCIPCGLIIHCSKRYFHIVKDNTMSDNRPSVFSFLTDGAFMIYVTSAFIFTLLGPVEPWFVVDVAVLKGFGIQEGTVLLSLNGIFGLIGRIVCITGLRFYPDTRPEVHTCYGFFAFAIAHFVVIVSPVYWGMFLGMVIRGISSAIVVAFWPCLQLELRGPENFPQTVAITNMLMGISDILGGYIGGLSADVTGAYNLIFYIASIGGLYCAMCMVIIYVIFKRRKRNNSRLYQQLP